MTTFSSISRMLGSLFLGLLMLSLGAPSPLLAQEDAGRGQASTGAVAGTITDATTGETLPGANVRVAGLQLGAAADLRGSYRILGVPTTADTLIVTFIGYETQRVPLTVEAGTTVQVDVALSIATVQGEGVTVTAQLAGQKAALNQQVSSNTIVNVVARDRIAESPDENAAESVARLPGVAAQRDGGEGSKVIVRGLSPKFTSVTINGERIPATDAEDRSVDLSLISSDLLEGIEVFKALTPDKDADAIGGTVNLVIKRAPETFEGRLRGEYGYNSLAGELGDARVSGSVSNRFLDERLGVIATGNFQRAQRDSEGLENDVTPTGGAILIRNTNLASEIETRNRVGGSLTFDYDLSGGELQWRTFFSHTDRDELRRRQRYRVDDNQIERDLRDRERFTQLFSTGLSGEHAFQRFTLDYQATFARTLSKTPESLRFRFRQLGGFAGGVPDADETREVVDAATPNLGDTFFQDARRESERGVDRDLTAAVNLEVPFRAGDRIAGRLKTGAKVRDKNRTRDLVRFDLTDDSLEVVAEQNGYTFYAPDRVGIQQFLDTGFDAGNFLDDEFAFGPGLAAGPLRTFNTQSDGALLRNAFEDLSDYEAGEQVAASYLMTELNLGSRLLLVGGLRYEHTWTDFTSRVGSEGLEPDVVRTRNNEELGIPVAIRDTTGGQDYGRLFPQITARYAITDAFNVRAALTRSLARPDYFDLVAFEQINDADNEIARGNPALQPTTAWNLDLVLSVYNDIGLFSVGGYYKRLTDFQYNTIFFEVPSFSNELFEVQQTRNGEAGTVYGVEVDVQAGLTFLPGPLSGFVVNANYAFATSEAVFPSIAPQARNPDGSQPQPRRTTIERRLPNQARHVANISLGYERGGFSGRVSVSIQDNFLTSFQPPTQAEIDENATSTSGFSDTYIGVDASFSQRLGFLLDGLRLRAEANNLIDEPETSFVGTVRESQAFFGRRIDVGVTYSF
ncbi:MAG: TonB-dependent receptor [Bacteroidetes bacterium]|nr:TonB-dependent receptor [Bacteroidota bacterium]